MKKAVSILLTSALSVVLLASCGGSDTATTENGEKVVTVGRWGGNDAETAAIDQVFEDFTAQTGIEVEERVYTDYNMELQTELIGGTAPDVFYVDAYMAPFLIEQGTLAPLDYDEYNMDAIYPNLVDDFEKDGQYYAISKDYSTLALYYNKAWVNEEDIPTSLEELYSSDFLLELGETLPEGVVPMLYNQDLSRNMFIAQNGGASIAKDEIYSNLSDPQVVENLSLLYDAALEGKIKTPADIGMGWNGDVFGNQSAAMMLEGNWVIGFLRDNFPEVEYGVIEIPPLYGTEGTMLFNVGYAMNANAKHPEEAAEFIKFATGFDGMYTWTEGAGVLPSRMDVAEARGLLEDPIQAPHIAGADYATTWELNTTLEIINTEYKNYIPSVVNGERTLEEALTVAEEEANKVIEANN